MAARVLFPNTVGCVENCASICGNKAGCTDLAYIKLVMNLLDPGKNQFNQSLFFYRFQQMIKIEFVGKTC